jgi:hypothetical protein
MTARSFTTRPAFHLIGHNALSGAVDQREEPLSGLPPATCYRFHGQADEHLGVFGAVWLADVKRALAATEPTDEWIQARRPAFYEEKP